MCILYDRVVDSHVPNTGWGRHSKGAPVLKPAVQKLLTSGLGPPLVCETPPHNPGSLCIDVNDLYTWLARDDVVLGVE